MWVTRASLYELIDIPRRQRSPARERSLLLTVMIGVEYGYVFLFLIWHTLGLLVARNVLSLIIDCVLYAIVYEGTTNNSDKSHNENLKHQ